MLNPTQLQPTSEDELLESYVGLTRELGRVPVEGDLMLKRRADRTFPSHSVFGRRFGLKAELNAKAREYCLARQGLEDIAHLFPVAVVSDEPDEPMGAPSTGPHGFVYLLKVGRHYKIGKTNSVSRRERELEIQLPEKFRTVHVIKTDDPQGIEAYWHTRFASKRGNGEWFELSTEDVAAFKRRRFQ